MAVNVTELRTRFTELLVDAAKGINEDRAAAAASPNPYERFMLPSAVVNHQPAAPLFDEEKVEQVVKDGLDALNDGEFLEVLKSVLGTGISLLKGF